MSACRLLFQWAGSIKIQLRVLAQYKANIVLFSFKCNLRHFDMWRSRATESMEIISVLKDNVLHCFQLFILVVVFFVEVTGVTRENHRQNSLQNVVSSTLHMGGTRTLSISRITELALSNNHSLTRIALREASLCTSVWYSLIYNRQHKPILFIGFL
jgi:hypothetical protein